RRVCTGLPCVQGELKAVLPGSAGQNPCGWPRREAGKEERPLAQRQAPPRFAASARGCSFSSSAHRTTRPAAETPSELLFFDRGVLRPGRNPLVGFQSFFCQVDGFFQLRVVATHNEIGSLRDDIIRIHTMLLDDPFAAVVGAPEGEARSSDKTAVAQRLHVSDAHQSAPRARADDGADLFAVEEPGKSIAP